MVSNILLYGRKNEDNFLQINADHKSCYSSLDKFKLYISMGQYKKDVTPVS